MTAQKRGITETQDMQPEREFNFPSVGPHGITVMAGSMKEAQEKVDQLRKDMEENEKKGQPKAEEKTAIEKTDE